MDKKTHKRRAGGWRIPRAEISSIGFTNDAEEIIEGVFGSGSK